MVKLFCSTEVRYHNVQTGVELTFVHQLQERATAKKALEAQEELERKLDEENLKTWRSPQRRDTSIKGNTVNVAQALSKAVYDGSQSKVTLMFNKNINLEEIALTQLDGRVNRGLFRVIYLANEELLSSQFTHVSTQQFNKLKEELIANLNAFELSVLNKKNSKFSEKLQKIDKEQNKNIYSACCDVVKQTKHLIANAKTVSAVIASLAIEADVLAQMGIAEIKS